MAKLAWWGQGGALLRVRFTEGLGMHLRFFNGPFLAGLGNA